MSIAAALLCIKIHMIAYLDGIVIWSDLTKFEMRTTSLIRVNPSLLLDVNLALIWFLLIKCMIFVVEIMHVESIWWI